MDKERFIEDFEDKYYSWWDKLLDKDFGWLAAVLISLLILIMEIYVVCYWIFPNIILPIWDWGIQGWFQTIIAVIVELFIFSFVIFIISYPVRSLSAIISFYVKSQEELLIGKQRSYVKNLENWIMEELEYRIEKARKKGKSKEAKIIQDIRDIFYFFKFRREHLNLYYDMNFSQVIKSFRYSVLAMFIGFFIIVIGILGAFGILEIAFPGIKPIDVDNVVIAGGILAEMISALFLWIYRTSLLQLTYFYKYQVHAHNVFISYLITNTMDKKIRDSTRKELIKEFLKSLSSELNIEAPPKYNVKLKDKQK